MPRSQFGLQQRGTTAGEPNHKDGRGRARCWAGLQRDGFDGFEGAACFLDPTWAPATRWRWSTPTTRLHDHPRRRGFFRCGTTNAFARRASWFDPKLLGECSGPAGAARLGRELPRRRRQTARRAADRRGLPPTPPLRRVGRCGSRAERAPSWTSNAGWSALEEIQCSREITLVQTEFAQTACGFWATRHELERLLPVVFRFVVSSHASEAVPGQSKQHWIFGSCGEQRSNQGQSASEIASGQGFVQVQRNSFQTLAPFFSGLVRRSVHGLLHLGVGTGGGAPASWLVEVLLPASQSSPTDR